MGGRLLSELEHYGTEIIMSFYEGFLIKYLYILKMVIFIAFGFERIVELRFLPGIYMTVF